MGQRRVVRRCGHPFVWTAIAVLGVIWGFLVWLILYFVYLVATQPPRTVMAVEPVQRNGRRHRRRK